MLLVLIDLDNTAYKYATAVVYDTSETASCGFTYIERSSTFYMLLQVLMLLLPLMHELVSESLPLLLLLLTVLLTASFTSSGIQSALSRSNLMSTLVFT